MHWIGAQGIPEQDKCLLVEEAHELAALMVNSAGQMVDQETAEYAHAFSKAMHVLICQRRMPQSRALPRPQEPSLVKLPTSPVPLLEADPVISNAVNLMTAPRGPEEMDEQFDQWHSAAR
jgi:hypothetical protein